MGNFALPHHYDVKDDILTIAGIRYSGDVFRQLGGALPVGSIFKLERRDDDGVIAIYIIERGDK